ncbi:FimV/HubP family polar landmark protein [Photobacterium sanguinicancri]|uniref:FimV/HubP family polar landmark protein n=1 Tax=Photobacterium sanguinicancri TaxID=875932 RepID=A0AAW7Y6J2_9GAMM|nr:FimV/HubP family polar landmark protein [Photobacterium sanguinicancri]MDO6542508.1 FimV/HubP family polar landmark protein [Photobacterium sanguinicancri]
MQHEVAALQDQQTSDGILRDEIKDFLAQQKTIEMQPVVQEPSLLDQLIANPWALAAAAFIPGALIAGIASYLLFGRRKEEDADDVKSLDSPNAIDPAVIPPNDSLLAGADDPTADLALSGNDDIDDLFAQDDALFDDPEDSLFAPQLRDDDDTLDLSSSDDFDIDSPLGGASSISVTGDEQALGLEDMERALDEMEQSSELSSDEALAAMWEQSLKEDDEQPNFDLSDNDGDSNDELLSGNNLDNGMLDQSLLDELLLEAEQADSSSSSKPNDSNDVVAQSELDALFDSFDSADSFDSPEQDVSDELAEQAAIDAALAEASAMANPEASLTKEANAASLFSEADTQRGEPESSSSQSEQDLIDDIFATSFASDDNADDNERILDESSTALLDELLDDDDIDLGDASNITLDENSTALLDELLGDDEQETSLFNSDIEIDENSTALLDELLGDDESLDPDTNSIEGDFDVDDMSDDDINIDELIIDENSTDLLDELLGETIESSDPSSLDMPPSDMSSPDMSPTDIDDIFAQQSAIQEPAANASVEVGAEIDNQNIDDIQFDSIGPIDSAIEEQEETKLAEPIESVADDSLADDSEVAEDDLDALLAAYGTQSGAIEPNQEHTTPDAEELAPSQSVYDEPEFEAPTFDINELETNELDTNELESPTLDDSDDADFASDFNDILNDALAPKEALEPDPFENDETASTAADGDLTFDEALDANENLATNESSGVETKQDVTDNSVEPTEIELTEAESVTAADDHNYDDLVAEVEGLLNDTEEESSPVGRRVDELLEEIEHAEALANVDVANEALTSAQVEANVAEPEPELVMPEPEPEPEPFSLDDFPEFTEEDALSDPEASEFTESAEPQAAEYQVSDKILDDELPEFDENAAMFDPEAEALESELADIADDEQQSALDNVVKQLQQAVEASESTPIAPSITPSIPSDEAALETRVEPASVEAGTQQEAEQTAHTPESDSFNVAKAESDFEFETIDLNTVPEFSEDDARQASYDEQHELEQYDIEQGLTSDSFIDDDGAEPLETTVEAPDAPQNTLQPETKKSPETSETSETGDPVMASPVNNAIDQQLVDSAGLDMDALLTDPDAWADDGDISSNTPAHSTASDIDLTAFDESSDALAKSEMLSDEIPFGLDDIESQERDQLLFNEDPLLDDQSLEMSEDDAAVWASISEEPRLASEDWSEQPQMQVEEVDRFDAESLLDEVDEQDLLLDDSDDVVNSDTASYRTDSRSGDEPANSQSHQQSHQQSHKSIDASASGYQDNSYLEADSELLDETKPSPASYISIDELLKESEFEDDFNVDIDLDNAPLNLDVGLDEFPDILAGVPEYDVDSQGEYASKLDLAKAYLEMNDAEGAADLLRDIAQNGDAQSAQEATHLLKVSTKS